ncbi:DnaJ domain-containing protein [Endozoicomonas sp. 8E]|uniref:DnaJ domain-containing protein n=1 Tax=Endozoicomonas sp. 8E TaxID=3035692 RepID=UPI00293903E0|nr:DnaJ domain-containing protein [Endozoicomonas sp. 8E]WOG29142.1 DnaJ domain-containing protein [Endozoicomonas sp. 8E]
MTHIAQLLERYNRLLIDPNLSDFKIQGIPGRDEFRKKYKKLVLRIHPDKAGKDKEELFKTIFPICEELMEKL